MLTISTFYGILIHMRNETDTEKNLAPEIVPTSPWRVTRVQALPDYRLAVQFIDGTEEEVDLSRLVTSEHAGEFSALRDPAIFPQGFLDFGAVAWPGEIDLAP